MPHSTILLGDLNDDNADEVAVLCSPYLCIYTTGPYLDSLIDVIYNGYGNFTRLGNIDGSGVASIAFSYNRQVHFLKPPPKDEIPTYGGRIRDLPHRDGFRCQHVSSVQGEQETVGGKMNLSQQQFNNHSLFVPTSPHHSMKVQP